MLPNLVETTRVFCSVLKSCALCSERMRAVVERVVFRWAVAESMVHGEDGYQTGAITVWWMRGAWGVNVWEFGRRVGH